MYNLNIISYNLYIDPILYPYGELAAVNDSTIGYLSSSRPHDTVGHLCGTFREGN